MRWMILILFSVNIFAMPPKQSDEWDDTGKAISDIQDWRAGVEQAAAEPPAIPPVQVKSLLEDPAMRYKLALLAIVTLALVCKKQ